MNNDWASVGVVHLRDLVDRSRWDTRKLPAYLDRLGGEVGALEGSALSPPRQLIVLSRAEELDLWPQFRCWLGQARELHLALCYNEPLPDSTRDALEREVLTLLAGLPIVRIEHWEKGAPAPPALVDLLARASFGLPTPTAFPAVEVRRPAGEWIELPRNLLGEPELMWPRWCCLRDGRPSLFYPPQGRFLDVVTGEWGEPVAPRTDNLMMAVWPDGERLISSNHAGDFSVLDLRSRALKLFKGPRGAPIGIWPGGQTGWAGYRSRFSWLTFQEGEGGLISACDHDWPTGHEKKQHGYLDNEPCWVQLSPINDAYLSAYQKDVVVSQTLPVGWRTFGPGWAALAEPASDPTRALFFVNDGSSGLGDPEEAEDGDAREARPVIALGPDPTCRYALDLSRPVYRVVGPTVSLVDEWARDGYAVFDASHQPVREGEGRLLGGWGRWLTVLHQERLWSEEIGSGERLDLGREAEEISWAFSLPASPNMLLVQERDTRVRVRLV